MKNIIRAALFAGLVLGQTGCGNPFESYAHLPDTQDEEGVDKQSEAEIEAAEAQVKAEFGAPVEELSTNQKAFVLTAYNHLDPGHVVPTDLLEKAVVYFDQHKSSFKNKNYIAVVDFKKRSTNTRMWLINMSTGAVKAIHVAHGKNSDTNNDGYATSFSNTSGSKKSSLGAYKVAEIYSGKYGRSVRLDGLSSTNSNVRRRAIVIHGSDYVHEASVIQGRSWGCFAMDWSVKNDVVDKLNGGSLLYAGVSN